MGNCKGKPKTPDDVANDNNAESAADERKPNKKDKQKKTKQKKNKNKKQKDGDADDGAMWESRLLENKVKPCECISRAAILDLDGRLKAAIPPDFVPDSLGVKDILSALVEGRTSGLAERGVVLGDPVPVCTPGKLEEYKSILATDGEHGGVAIYRTKQSLLLIVFETDPDTANRLSSELADYMDQNDR